MVIARSCGGNVGFARPEIAEQAGPMVGFSGISGMAGFFDGIRVPPGGWRKIFPLAVQVEKPRYNGVGNGVREPSGTQETLSPWHMGNRVLPLM